MPLSNDPAKARQWRERSQQKAIAKMREKGQKLAPRERAVTVKPGGLDAAKRDRKPPKRDNFGPWRDDVMAAYGEACKNCGDRSHVEADHVIPRSQDKSARFDVENGLPLCGAFTSNPDGSCHEAKTSGTLKFRAEWFTPAQLEYLAAKGYVDWDDDGNPYGRGYKHFEARTVRDSRNR